MPFLAEEQYPIPNKDILSWGFDDPKFDQDRPLWIDAEDTTRSISGNQARTLIRQLAAGFRKAGLKPGDTVCVASFNDIYYSVLVLGIIAAGCVYTGTNPAYTPHELEHHLRIARVQAVICEPELLAPIVATSAGADLLAQRSSGADRIFIFDHHANTSIPAGYPSWRALTVPGAEADWPRFDDEATAAGTTAMLLFSSGTSGLPKAVDLSHRNLIAQHELAWAHPEYRPPWTPVRRLYFLPSYHAAVVPSLHVAPIRSGDEYFVQRRFEPAAALRACHRLRITDTILVPPCVLAIVNAPASVLDAHDLSSLRWARVGAAPLDRDMQARFQRLLERRGGKGRITQVLGMTETSCLSFQFRPDEADATGSVGRIVPSLDVKIVDDEGRDVTADGVEGELCIRGPTIVRGYFENEEANKRDWDAEGYLHTGDIVYRDGKTKLWYIVDRKKELIKVRGFQVAPPEVEGVLLAHEDILDAAVIGVFAAETQSEAPRAYVVRRPGATLTADDVKKLVSDKLVKYKWLDGGVVFVDQIPRTASGKILKRVLRERAKAEVGRAAKL